MRILPAAQLRLFRWAAVLFLTLLCISGCGRGSLQLAETEDEMVYYGITSRIRGFDPVKAGDVSSSMAASKVYEGLLQYAYLDRPYHVEPLLAEAMPAISEDGLTYTFRLRKGIYFQDDPCFTETNGNGRELVAEDFVYSIKRVADLKNASSGYWVYNDRIAGLDEWRRASGGEEPTDYAAAIPGLYAPDPYTLVIKLTRPYPQLLWILTMHYSFAIPHEAVSYYGPEFLNHPVGTGPYILKEWQRNYRIEFVRNPKWAETGRVETFPEVTQSRDLDAGLGQWSGLSIPFIDRVVQYVIGDSSTQWMMFLAGQFEVSGVSRDNWDAVITPDKQLNEELTRKGIVLSSNPTMDLFYIGFNMDDPVVGQSADPEVDARHRALRQALTCALNSAEWERFANNRIIRPKGPIPPGVAGYSERPETFPFDLERARNLLLEAGYPDEVDPATGRRLELTLELGSADSAEIRQSTELLIDFYSKIGVDLSASYNNWPTFLDKMDRRQAQMFRLGWIADYPDAENFLQLFYGLNRSPGPNHCNYVNPEFDALYDQVRVMSDGPERTALYEKMADIVIQDCPWIFTSLPLSYGLTHSWIQAYVHHDFPYGMIKYYRIDVAARKAWKEQNAQ